MSDIQEPLPNWKWWRNKVPNEALGKLQQRRKLGWHLRSLLRSSLKKAKTNYYGFSTFPSTRRVKIMNIRPISPFTFNALHSKLLTPAEYVLKKVYSHWMLHWCSILRLELEPLAKEKRKVPYTKFQFTENLQKKDHFWNPDTWTIHPVSPIHWCSVDSKKWQESGRNTTFSYTQKYEATFYM